VTGRNRHRPGLERLRDCSSLGLGLHDRVYWAVVSLG
jgi:hypothetical protein